MNVRLAIMVYLLLIASCSNLQPIPASREIGSLPPLNVVSSTGVGEIMLTEFDYLNHHSQVVETKSDYTWKKLAASIWIPSRTQMNCASGICCTNESVYKNMGDNRGVCFTDKNSDFVFEEMQVAGTFKTMSTDIDYQVIEDTSSMNVTEGFRHDLLYQGVAANVLRVIVKSGV